MSRKRPPASQQVDDDDDEPIGQDEDLTVQSMTCSYSKIPNSSPQEIQKRLAVSDIGLGTFNNIKPVHCHSKNRFMAMKVVNKRDSSRQHLFTALCSEMAMRLHLSHPNIIATYNILETEDQVFFLMDLAAKGNLHDYMSSSHPRGFVEADARYLFSQLLEGVKFLHFNDIAHRDLTLSNLLLDDDMNVKITGFGNAVVASNAPTMNASGIQAAYRAPEVLNMDAPHDELKADIWSMGVILFALATGSLVFGNDERTPKRQQSQVNFPPSSELPLSTHLKNLILCLLKRDPTDRLDCDRAARHRWVMGCRAAPPPPPPR